MRENQRSGSRHRKTAISIRVIPRGEEGTSLAIALAVMVVLGVISAGVIMYAQVAYSSTVQYREQRSERYSGDGAIASAVNYLKENGHEMVDPDLGGADCRYIADTDVGPVTVDCTAERGSGSGQPSDVGLVPPEAVVLLGTRHGEPGPYNGGKCSGWFDPIVNFLGIKLGDTGGPEPSGLFKKRTGLGLLGASCNDVRTRGNQGLKVRGDFMAAGRLEAVHGMSVEQDVSEGPTTMFARAGCAGLGATCTSTPPPNRTAQPGQPHLAGTAPDTDPGRSAPSDVNAPPIQSSGALDVATAWQPVGFDTHGSPLNLGYAMPGTSSTSTMPERNTAYIWDGDTAYTPVSTCPNNTSTIVFLPGWYKDSEVLSRYTTAANCADVNFWFAPNPGPDGVLLTDDDETGAFYFDFQGTAGRRCGPKGDDGNPAPANPYRWCVGGTPTQNARIVAGTPQNWSPTGTLTFDGSGGLESVGVVLDHAKTVDDDLSFEWIGTPGGARKIDDGEVAQYKATLTSTDRAIRVRDIVPDGKTKATSPPVAQAGAPNGKVFVTVKYAVQNAASADPAEVVIEAKSKESGTKQCGTYKLFGYGSAAHPYDDKTQAEGDAGNLHEYTFTDSQATELADRCGKLDLLNGLEVKVQVKGNFLNIPKVNWWLDGVKIHWDAHPSAAFPVEESDVEPAAKSDCDPDMPGAQLLFGGASHVYIADGSLEICAGQHPVDPMGKQSIGVWALPPVPELKPASVPADPKAGNARAICTYDSSQSVLDALRDIDGHRAGTDRDCGPNGKNRDANVVVIEYGGCANLILWEPNCSERNIQEAGFKFTMEGYQAPAGYHVAKVEARISYNPKNQGCSALWACDASANPHFQPGGNGDECGRISLPRSPDHGPLQTAAFSETNLVLFDKTTARDCLGVSSNHKAIPQTNATFWARAQCVAQICIGPFADTLDGVRYQVTLEPDDSSFANIRPQSGCTINHPNYDAGYGNPDCAIVRADTGIDDDNWYFGQNLPPWLYTAELEGKWGGRFSVKGTIWAPGSALEVDDSDVAYPLADRGVVLRHLRVSGWGKRQGYEAPAISNTLDDTPDPRMGNLVACIQTEARRNAGAPCDAAQDEILSEARAFFVPQRNPAWTSGSTTEDKYIWDADVEWWTNRR